MDMGPSSQIASFLELSHVIWHKSQKHLDFNDGCDIFLGELLNSSL